MHSAAILQPIKLSMGMTVTNARDSGIDGSIQRDGLEIVSISKTWPDNLCKCRDAKASY